MNAAGYRAHCAALNVGRALEITSYYFDILTEYHQNFKERGERHV